MEKEKYELKDIVAKLVGPIEPIGESNADKKRFENLKALTGLVESILLAVNCIAFHNRNRVEYSMKRAGQHADRFLAMMAGEYKPESDQPAMALKAETEPISQRGYKLVKFRRPTDHKNHPAVSIQMPDDVADYVTNLINRDQGNI